MSLLLEISAQKYSSNSWRSGISQFPSSLSQRCIYSKDLPRPWINELYRRELLFSVGVVCIRRTSDNPRQATTRRSDHTGGEPSVIPPNRATASGANIRYFRRC